LGMALPGVRTALNVEKGMAVLSDALKGKVFFARNSER
jgi:hypothetical protein